VIAHAGHWIAEALYVAPVVIVVGWISVKALLDRRRERRDAPPEPPPTV
jgi:hypothetical protein